MPNLFSTISSTVLLIQKKDGFRSFLLSMVVLQLGCGLSFDKPPLLGVKRKYKSFRMGRIVNSKMKLIKGIFVY